VIGLLVLTFAQGCSTKEVKDFASWCQYIHDPKIGQYDVFRMDKQAVIDGVVAAWDRIIVENSAQALGSPANIDSDSVMSELRKARVVGAWRQGDTLHFALGLIVSPIVDPSRSTAEVLAREYGSRLASVNQDRASERMDSVTYCLYSGISVFFARLDIHASDGTAAVTNATFEKLKRYN